jgi:hypothetical protein
MQVTDPDTFTRRLFPLDDIVLGSKDCRRVVLLTFLISVAGVTDGSTWMDVHFKDEKTGNVIVSAEAICVDLFAIAAMLRANDSIKIRGNILGDAGREWLKLLSVRHWASRSVMRYFVPAMSSLYPAINSALAILEQVKDEQLLEYVRQERVGDGQLSRAFEEGVREAWEKKPS